METYAPIHEPAAAKRTYVQSRVYVMTANEESRYHALLQVAAEMRRLPETAAVKKT